MLAVWLRVFDTSSLSITAQCVTRDAARERFGQSNRKRVSDAIDAKKYIYHILTGPGTRARDFYINYRTGGRSLGRHLRLELARERPRRAQPEEDDAEEDRREVRRARRQTSTRPHAVDEG